MHNMLIEVSQEQKDKYFTALRERVAKAMALHSEMKLLLGVHHNPEIWDNVARHCLMEAARAEIFAEILALSEELAHELRDAAALHDFYKPCEIEAIQAALTDGGSSFEASFQAGEEASRILRDQGWSERVIAMVGGVGGFAEVQLQMYALASQPTLSNETKALLAMHYIDDYTRGDLWAEPATALADGRVINDIDRRMEKNRNNPNYTKIGKTIEEKLRSHRAADGQSAFEGQDSFASQGMVSHLIEQRLAPPGVDPVLLPEHIDSILKTRIAETL